MIFSKGFVVYFYEVICLFISGYKFKLNKYLFKINGFWGGVLNYCVNVYFFLYFLNIIFVRWNWKCLFMIYDDEWK